MIVRSLALVATTLLLGTLGTSAQARQQGRGSQAQTVSACSLYGNGCYTAPVRQGRFGPEMRLKGGTWIDCRGSCQDALREETVDFWETLRDRSSQD